MIGWLVLLLAAVTALDGCGAVSPARQAEASTEVIVVQPIVAARRSVCARVASGDTIESVCRRLAGSDWVVWRDALAAEIDPRRLRPGLVFEGEHAGAGGLETLRVTVDPRTELTLRREGRVVVLERVERPVAGAIVRLEGEIVSSLFGAVEAAGGRPDLAVRLAEIFQWDVDFLRDLRRGDRFVVIVEEESVEGAFYRYGEIFAARFVNDDRVLSAVAYPDGAGRVGYYDLDGKPLRKQFLRSPLKFSRVTSSFSMRRFHPVLKRPMPHYGVDYGAPAGTPAMVTADGVVTFAGVKGGAGRMVTVRHTNGYETNYLHLSRLGSGVRNGVRVSQGQVIGFVGSTGLSTGPHLDYRVRHNGRWVNPLTIASPPAKPLEPERMTRFLSHALAVIELIEGREPPDGASC